MGYFQYPVYLIVLFFYVQVHTCCTLEKYIRKSLPSHAVIPLLLVSA